MNERALISILALLVGTSACVLLALFIPRTGRLFWILELSLALSEFGAITLGVLIRATSTGTSV